MCRARTTDALRQSLHRTGNGRRPDRSLDAAKHRVFGRDDEVACQRKFKGATKRRAANGSHRRNLQRLYGAERLVAFGDEGSELMAILLQEVEHIAPWLKLRPSALTSKALMSLSLASWTACFREFEKSDAMRFFGGLSRTI
jgi:hypothetical protein